MANLLRHELQSRLGAIIGWSLGLTLFGGMYISLFPDVADQMAGLADLPIYQAMGIQLASFEGYIASTVVLFLPVILGIYAIITSTQALAGEEDRGTLELVVTMPLYRWQIVTTKAIAIAIVTLVILAIAGLGDALVLRAIKARVEVDVSPWQLFVAVLNGWPLLLAFMMMGLFLGAFLPNRRTAALVLTVVFIASYFGENLAGLVESLEPIRPLSLFSYYESSAAVFEEGVQASDVGVLLGIALVLYALALLSFRRRNVTAGSWPWQRPKVVR